MIDCGLHRPGARRLRPQMPTRRAIVKAEEQRAQFLRLFPKEGWPAMTLDRYALGQADHPDNFCRWMEFVTTELGSIRGGSARKHLIYFQAARASGGSTTSSSRASSEAWEAVHKGFVDAIAPRRGRGMGARSSRSRLFVGGRALAEQDALDLLPRRAASDQLADAPAPLPAGSLESPGRRPGARHHDAQPAAARGSPRRAASSTGWTTKQMERLLYSSELDPFMAQPPERPNRRRGATSSHQTLERGRRRPARSAPRRTRIRPGKLLDESAGNMTQEQVRERYSSSSTLTSATASASDARFSPAFVGQTANALVGEPRELQQLDRARCGGGPTRSVPTPSARCFQDRKLLPSAGTSYPTMLAVPADPETVGRLAAASPTGASAAD